MNQPPFPSPSVPFVQPNYVLPRDRALEARLERLAAYRTEAEQAWIARCADYYGRDPHTYSEADLPLYKQRDSEEWEEGVAAIQRELLDAETPDTPVPPFDLNAWRTTFLTTVADAYGYTLRNGLGMKADTRVERRLAPIVMDATSHHDLHGDHVHPWCLDCHVREAQSTVNDGDLNTAHQSTEALLDDAHEDCEARVRWWLLADKAIPKHPTSMTPPEPPRQEWFNLAALAEMPDPEWLVDGLIPASGVGYIVGRDGVKKTFLALDLALSVVTGRDFHGRQMNDEAYSGAIFVAGEGASSFGARTAAWAAAQDYRWTPDDYNFFSVRAGGVNLYRGGDDYAGLLEKVRDQQPDLVVFDTLQRCAEGADQNSAADMAVVTARLDEVKRASGGTVLVIAHTDKGDNDARGSSSIEDDADFVIHVKDKDGVVEAKVTKQKDGETGTLLRLVPVQHAGSIALVLADQTNVAEVTSSSPRLRILNALRLAHGEQLDVDAVHRAATTRDAPIARGTVDNLLREMANKGEIRREQVGARRRALYYLDPVLDAGVGITEALALDTSTPPVEPGMVQRNLACLVSTNPSYPVSDDVED